MKRPSLPLHHGSKLDNYIQKGKLDYKFDPIFEWRHYNKFEDGYICCICGNSMNGLSGWYSICREQMAHDNCSVNYSIFPIWVD